MLRVKLPRDGAGVITFIKVLMGEANRKRLDRVRTEARHERHDDGGIHSSAQQRSQRDIADQPHPNRFSKPMLELFQAFLLGLRFIGSISWQIPILLNADPPIRKFEELSGRSLLYAL